MHRTRVMAGGVLIVVGAVWFAQGAGLLRGSGFMDGDPLWMVLGAVAVAFGIGFIWVGLRRRT